MDEEAELLPRAYFDSVDCDEEEPGESCGHEACEERCLQQGACAYRAWLGCEWQGRGSYHASRLGRNACCLNASGMTASDANIPGLYASGMTVPALCACSMAKQGCHHSVRALDLEIKRL